MLALIPGSFYYARRNFEIKKICEWAGERGFTNLIILGQGLQLGGNKKFPCSMLLVHLPEGPTLHFRLSSIKLPDEIKHHARATKHKPELILNQFTTRLGIRVSRAISSLFPQVTSLPAMHFNLCLHACINWQHPMRKNYQLAFHARQPFLRRYLMGYAALKHLLLAWRMSRKSLKQFYIRTRNSPDAVWSRSTANATTSLFAIIGKLNTQHPSSVFTCSSVSMHLVEYSNCQGRSGQRAFIILSS